MKPRHLVLGALLLLVPATAAAQPANARPAQPQYQGYYAQPSTVPGGFHDRQGRLMLGFSLGLGGMKIGDDEVTCANCDYDPVAFEVDFHIGGMMSPRFGVMLEVQANGKTIEESAFGATSLVQATAMAAAQYWVTPQFWVKGGLGFASLGYSYDDEFDHNDDSEELARGGALMVGAGYELLSAKNFSIDLQARFVQGTYEEDDLGDNPDVSSGSIGVGFNWF